MGVHPYLLFHSLAEIASATVTFGTFVFAWNTRRYQNAYLRTLGMAALFVGVFEALHCLAFPGMPVFPGYDANLSPQLWLAARTLQAAAGIGGLLLLGRTPRVGRLLAAFGAASAIVVAAIFLGWAPDAVAQPRGLTPFKVAAEWGLAAAFLGSVALLARARAHFSPRVFRLLVAHALTMAACEICFTLYLAPYDAANLLGHLLLLAAGALQYLAIMRAGLVDPSETHFRDLTQAKERLERAQSAGRVGTFEWDLRGGGPVAIAGMDGVYGEAPGRLTGRYEDWLARVRPEDRARVERLLEEVLAGRAQYDTEYGVLWPDGTTHWVAARASLQRDEQGRPARLVGVNLDVTERRRAEEALREANRRLEEADARKNQFLAVLSHELRNPLAPIANSLYVLDRAPAGGAQAARARQVIARQVAQLSNLVNDLLDVTRITQNKIRLSRERLELGEVVRRAVEDNRSLFDDAGLRLELAPAPGPLPVHADATRVAQVVGNLLHNAAKFTPRGGTTRVRVGAEAGQAVVRVADDGVGIGPETLGRLFQAFVQAEQTLERSKGGLGLGLALVKGLVELHGGSVEARSDGPGRGAEFVVRLPLEAAPAAQPAADGAPPARAGRRVLVIEDNRDAAESLREALELGGHEVDVAYDGPEGVARARAMRPDVVLCDIGLPGMDGYEVARALRADRTLRHARLVALSGYALAEDLQRAADAGFDRHLPKPPGLDRLEQLLAETPRMPADAA